MQQTYQDRLSLDPAQQRWLSAFGDLYGTLQRKLYVRIAKGESTAVIKPAFCAEHGLSARQYNAIRMELDGKISGTIELLKVRKKDIAQSIKTTTRDIAKLDQQIIGQNKLRDNEVKAIAKSKK